METTLRPGASRCTGISSTPICTRPSLTITGIGGLHDRLSRRGSTLQRRAGISHSPPLQSMATRLQPSNTRTRLHYLRPRISLGHRLQRLPLSPVALQQPPPSRRRRIGHARQLPLPLLPMRRTPLPPPMRLPLRPHPLHRDIPASTATTTSLSTSASMATTEFIAQTAARR
jgi:hypothetical protein